MDNGHFSVDTDGLHRQLPYVRQLAEHIRSVGSNLEARLGALGEPWGDDASGKEFLDQYQNPHHELLEGISGVGQVLDSTADGIQTMALRFTQLEEENTAAARQLHTPDQPDVPTGGSRTEHGRL
ncbi:WXG100 family type VII secretion target [Streptacidiphilus sp. N1-12]|uniref:WXG100 family type VII secretion target n=2 Tax=Streptacidiphilus alkalitolerans TaxID=3342712 RepID=A0ABV6V4Z9_9ACTN